MFGGRVHENELLNLRPANTERYEHKFRIASNDDLRALTRDDDPLDYALYEFVRERFIRLLQEYGLQVPDHILNPPDIYS